MKKKKQQPKHKPYRKQVVRKTSTGFSIDGRNVVVEHRRASNGAQPVVKTI